MSKAELIGELEGQQWKGKAPDLMEQALRESEARFRAIFELTSVGIVQADATTGRFLRVNDAFVRMIGYTASELLEKTLLDVMHPEDRLPNWESFICQVEDNASNSKADRRYVRKDGTILWCHVGTDLIPDAAGRLLYAVAAIHDITELKWTQGRLQQSEQRLELALNSSGAVPWFWSAPENRLEGWTPLYRKLYGFGPNEPATPDTWTEALHPDDLQRINDRVNHMLAAAGDDELNEEFRVVHPQLGERWLKALGRCYRDASGRVQHMAGVNLDITERKQAERALRESEERLDLAMKSSGAVAWGWNVPENRLEGWNSEYRERYGFGPDEPPAYDTWLARVHPDDRQRIIHRIERILATPGDDVWDEEFRILHPTRGERWLGGLGRCYRDRVGRAQSIVGVNFDITERKRAEQALRESEERLARLNATLEQHVTERTQALRDSEARTRAIVDTAAEGIVTVDERGAIESLNSAVEQMFGYTAEEIIGRDVSLLMPTSCDEESDNFLACCRQTSERKASCFGCEVLGQRKDGSTFPLELSVSEVELADRRIFSGILRDISKRKRDEEALRRSEDRYRSLLQAVPDLMFRLTADGTYVDCYAADPELLAMPLDKIIGTNIRQATLPPEVAKSCMAAFKRVLATGVMETIDYSLPLPIGQRHFETRVVRCGQTEVVVIVRDITQRVLAEEALRRSEANLSSAQKIAHIGSYEINLAGEGRDVCSAEAYRILGLDPATANLSPRKYLERLVHPADQARVREVYDEALNARSRFDLEYRIVRPDGSIRHVHTVAEVILEPDGQVQKLIGFLQDVTEHKLLEQEILQISEHEQSRIGHDLHDGLCQHLAGIEFRLLGIRQKLETQSTEQAADLTELAKLVREGIDQTRTLARGLSPVILDQDGLMDALRELANHTEQTFEICCSFHCPAPVFVEDNVVATHLYRIAQEAVRNAIQHGKAKLVVINLHIQNDLIVLWVKDDGIGFPKKPHNHQGMGLRIMQYRASMVAGSLTVQPELDGGTSVICSLHAETAQKTRIAANDTCVGALKSHETFAEVKR